MRIGVMTWGSAGDIRPFIALSRGLSEAGHDVSFAYADMAFTVTPQLAALSRARSCTAVPPAHDPATLWRVSNEIVLKIRSPAKQIVLVLESCLYPMEEALVRAAETLCRENDLVVGHFLLYPLAAVARKLGRRRISVFPSPALPSREYVPADAPDLGSLFNRAFWWASEFGLEFMFAGPPRRLYRAQGLPAARSLRSEVWRSQLLDLVTVSPSLFPQPKDWPSNVVVTGQLALPEEQAADWRMPEPLQDFLARGAPPVFMSFGSMMASEADAAGVTGRLVEAARLAGCRAIVQSEWARCPGVPEHPDVFRLSSAPHSALFPRCAAIVHHGGAGTSHAAVLAGKPSVVVAHATDQLFWARRLRRAGVAGAPLQRRTFTASALAKAIREVLETPGMTQRAAAIGERMKGEDGVRTAVRLIEECEANRRREAAKSPSAGSE